MRLRVSSMVFGGAVSMATLVLLYQVLSLPPDTRPPGEQKEIVSLESRLRRLESDLQANQLTITEIKNLVRQLAGSNSRANSLLGPQYGVLVASKFVRNGINAIKAAEKPNSPLKKVIPPVHYNLTHAAIMQDDCIFAQAAPAQADIQMEKVYNFLKFDNPDGGVWKQGWDIQYEAAQWSSAKKLKVFVVPHSHNDPGWLKTFDQYFTDQTRHILDHMVEKLSVDPRRKFIWAEISFFSMWWDQQSESIRDTVRRLVDRGQLEIVTGGWVMNDEANTHYFAMLEQMVEGHEWLKLNLGVKPNNGWAIDPFGMTATMPYLLKRMGLENMLIQRVHYSVKKQLAKEKSLEFKWRQVWDSGSTAEMFCHLMPFYSYDIPHTCGPDPKVCCQFDFRRLPGSGVTCPWKIPPQPITDHNVESRSQLILDQYRKKSQLYRTNVVLVPLGDDFRYVRPEEWDSQFINYQKIFDYLNSHEEMHVEAQFGTLADYFRAVHEESDGPGGEEQEIFPSLTGDFFTYADRDDHYWSGYYTSRPFHKSLDRALEGYLRGAEILFSVMLGTQSMTGKPLIELADSLMARLVLARRNLALFQHHDGITGTAREHVVVDYANRLMSSVNDCQHIIQQAANYLLAIDQHSYKSDPGAVYFELGEKYTEHNQIASKLILALQSGSAIPIFIYNPDAHHRFELFTIRTSSPYVEIVGKKDKIIPCQVDPVFIQSSEASPTMFDVTFQVDALSLSLTKYTIKAVEPDSVNSELVSYAKVIVRGMAIPSVPSVFTVTEENSKDPFTLHNEQIQATFTSNGLLQSITTQGHTVLVSLEFVKYGVKNHHETAGAYLFLPDKEAVPVPMGQPPVVLMQGSIMSTLSTQLKDILHTVKIKNSPGVDGMGIDITNLVDIRLERNFEFVMRFNTGINNEDVFYTDLNGFQISKRMRYSKLPLQANYYPIPSQAFIQDKEHRLSLLSAQPLGGSSLKNGQLEVMMDRRLMQDDNRGLGQGLQDNVLTSCVFRLLLEPRISTKESTTGSSREDLMAFPSLLAHAGLHSLLYPMYALLPTAKVGATQHRWDIGGELPCDVHMVNLRTMLDPPRATIGRTSHLTQHPPGSITSLTLHRLGFDCGFKSPGLVCSTNGGKVRLTELFPSMFNEQVHQMSLSMLYEGVDMTKSYTLSLQPMELYTFRLSRS
ncbi:alpha-mannosidase 2x-like isoform X2 [Homarus americanus]|nr:alpha-mannosidase 2x-like isoform X2 [Homarus americanus]